MTSTTAPRTEPAHVTPRPERPDRWAAISPGLRVVGLVATLVLIAALEVGAGTAAGWGVLAFGLPLAIDSFVLGVLLSPRARLADRLFALAFVEATVVISAVWGGHARNANVVLGGVLATFLVAALWRQDETIRRDRGHGDLIREATERADAAERRIAELEHRAGQVASDRARVEAGALARVEELRERAEQAERRAVAAEARASELDRQRREEHREERRTTPPRTSSRSASATTDADRTRIIRLVFAGGADEATGKTFEANPAAGRRTIADAIRDLGHTPGENKHLSELAEEVRARLVEEGHHLAPARTGTDD